MKKSLLFSLLLLLVSFSASSEKLNLSLTNLNGGWSSSYDANTKTITFDAGWVGRGWWYGSDTGADYSSYDDLVIVFEPTDSRFQVVIEYNGGAETTTVGVEAGQSTIRATLNPTAKANIKQVYMQKSTAGTVVLQQAYVEGDAPATNYNLSLSTLGSGWSSTYASDTKTITYEGNWAGKGWWLSPADFSIYKDVVVNFSATDASVKLVVQYSDDSYNTPDVYANAGESTIKVLLDQAKRNNVKQIYIQRATAGTLVLVSAFLTPAETTDLKNTILKNVYFSNNTLYLNKSGNVQLLDINGRLLLEKNNVISLDLSTLKSGVYLVKSIVEGKTQFTKLLK